MIFRRIVKRKLDTKNTLLFFALSICLILFIKYETLKIQYNTISANNYNPKIIVRNISSPMLFIGGSPRFDV